MPNSFPVVARADARILILGSMPGVASLKAQEYYAHPRNAFWSILEALYGIPRVAPYAQRLEALQNAGIALWDVLESCERQGSLDSAIIPESIVVNKIPELLISLPNLEMIATNGGTASKLFKTHVWQTMPPSSLRWQQLPSSSPANARISLEQKIVIWQEQLLLD